MEERLIVVRQVGGTRVGGWRGEGDEDGQVG